MLDCPVGLATQHFAREDRGNRIPAVSCGKGGTGSTRWQTTTNHPRMPSFHSTYFPEPRKVFFGVFIRLKIEDEKLRQTALGCYLIWSRELYKCLFAISCRLALRYDYGIFSGTKCLTHLKQVAIERGTSRECFR